MFITFKLLDVNRDGEVLKSVRRGPFAKIFVGRINVTVTDEFGDRIISVRELRSEHGWWHNDDYYHCFEISSGD